jgi:hypothetical protein
MVSNSFRGALKKLGVSLLCISLAPLVACQARDLPPVAGSVQQATEDDREVMKGVLDHLRRTIYLSATGLESPDPSTPRLTFLVFDSTVEICQSELPRLTICIPRQEMNRLEELMPGSRRLVETLFMRRNAAPMSIRGKLGDDVVYIPTATVDTPAQLSEFVNRYPPPRTRVAFSAPIYLRDQRAVIFYHHLDNSGGFIHLARVGATWSVAGSSAWIE